MKLIKSHNHVAREVGDLASCLLSQRLPIMKVIVSQFAKRDPEVVFTF